MSRLLIKLFNIISLQTHKSVLYQENILLLVPWDYPLTSSFVNSHNTTGDLKTLSILSSK